MLQVARIARAALHTLVAFLALVALLGLSAPSPALAAPKQYAAILYNQETGRILYARNPDMRVPPASLTKVLTMFVAMDCVKAGKFTFTTPVRISRTAATTGGSRMQLVTGERVTVERLLTGMAVVSGNDASAAMAERITASGTPCLTLMQRKTQQLGMTRSTFKTPHGLPAQGQLTTARDMLALTRGYLSAHPDALRFHSAPALRHRGAPHYNTNALLGSVEGVDGLKTGWTAASGYNIIVTAKRGKTRLIAVVMGAPSKAFRDTQAKRMIEAGFAFPKDQRRAAARIARP